MHFFRSRKFTVLALATLAVVSVFILWPRGAGKETVSYSEVRPQRGEIRVTVTSTGNVQPEGRIEMKPPVPGRVERVLVREGQKVRRGQIIAWMSSTERAALLDSARAVSAEEYARFQEYYRATPIVAPVAGTIILRNVEPGQTVSATDVLLVIADRLQVVARVDETDIARIEPGVTAEIVLDAYPQQPIAAIVSAIAFEARTVNNVTTYDVEVTPKTQPPFMRSGMTANVTFMLKKKADVLTLPLAAIQFRKDSPFVLVKNPQGKGEEVLVTVGDSDGSNTEISSGIDETVTILVPKMQAQSGRQGSNPFMPARTGPRQGSGRSGNRTH